MSVIWRERRSHTAPPPEQLRTYNIGRFFLSFWGIFHVLKVTLIARSFKHFKQCCGSRSVHVFGPSGSVSQRYGSGTFYHQAKIVRKTLISTVLWLLYDFLSLKNDVNVPLKKLSRIRNTDFNIHIILLIWNSNLDYRILRNNKRYLISNYFQNY